MSIADVRNQLFELGCPDLADWLFKAALAERTDPEADDREWPGGPLRGDF